MATKFELGIGFDELLLENRTLLPGLESFLAEGVRGIDDFGKLKTHRSLLGTDIVPI
jgi:hypothetical protein